METKFEIGKRYLVKRGIATVLDKPIHPTEVKVIEISPSCKYVKLSNSEFLSEVKWFESNEIEIIEKLKE